MRSRKTSAIKLVMAVVLQPRPLFSFILGWEKVWSSKQHGLVNTKVNVLRFFQHANH